jgi:hypothetical protein
VSTREIDEGESFAFSLSTPNFLPAESQEGRTHIFLIFRGMVGKISYRSLDCFFHDLGRECLVSKNRRCDALCVEPVSLNGSPHCPPGLVPNGDQTPSLWQNRPECFRETN